LRRRPFADSCGREIGQAVGSGREFDGQRGHQKIFRAAGKRNILALGNLVLLHFVEIAAAGVWLDGQSRTLRGVPGMKRASVGTSDREQRGVHAYAGSFGGGMQADVDSCPSGVGGPGALIERQGIVPMRSRMTAKPWRFEFMPEQAGESERNRFFLQAFVKAAPRSVPRGRESTMASMRFAGAMAAAFRQEADSQTYSECRRIFGVAQETAAVPAAGVPDEDRGDCDRASVVAEAGHQGNACGNGQIGGAVASENVAWVMAVCRR